MPTGAMMPLGLGRIALCCSILLLLPLALAARNLKQGISTAAIDPLPWSGVNAQWVHAVSTAFNADSHTLVVYQTPAPIGTTTKQLWQLYNQIAVPSSLGQANTVYKLNDVYAGLLGKLHPTDTSTEEQLRSALGDQYDDWVAHRRQYPNPNKPEQSMVDYFNNWAVVNVDDYATAVNAFYRQQNDPINVATAKLGACQRSADACGFSVQYDKDIRPAVQAAPSVRIYMDTQTGSTDYSDTMYHGEAGGSWEWLFGSVDATYRDTINKLQSSRITVEAEFEHGTRDIAGFVVPLDWYDTGVVSLAKKSKGGAFYQRADYDAYFGQNGTLQYTTGNLFLVSGKYSVKITVHTTISDEERTFLQTHVSGGIWPFFNLGGSTESTSLNINTSNGTAVFEYGSNFLVAPVAIAYAASVVG